MAGSKYAYVRNFELPDPLLLGTFIACRLDGHSFHRFSEVHGFFKPNDERALKLMDRAAQDVMQKYPDVILAFGQSDEYSFLLKKSTLLFNRRRAKILTTLTSLFTASYTFHWSLYFPDVPMQYPATFDGRIILYPGERQVRDYFAWRQADTHINNLYNTIFWAYVKQAEKTTAEAHSLLRGTASGQKQEILYSQFGVNYNDIPSRFRKGTTIVREQVLPERVPQDEPETSLQSEMTCNIASGGTIEKRRAGAGKKYKDQKFRIDVLHCDLINEAFWQARPYLLAD